VETKTLELDVRIGAGDRIEAVMGKQTIPTDENGSAPEPLDLFFASIGTCAGKYVARFCRKRNIPVDGIKIRQRMVIDRKTYLSQRIELTVELPEDFPDRYREAVIRAAGLCTVKRHLDQPPPIEVVTTKPSEG
jgi:ribosomal protein S12 methylthiotransferase accessory factor